MISFGIVNKTEVDVFLKQTKYDVFLEQNQAKQICLLDFKAHFLYHNATKMIPSLTLHIPGISVSNLGMKRGVFFCVFK